MLFVEALRPGADLRSGRLPQRVAWPLFFRTLKVSFAIFHRAGTQTGRSSRCPPSGGDKNCQHQTSNHQDQGTLAWRSGQRPDRTFPRRTRLLQK
jgi:hypothetical protein